VSVSPALPEGLTARPLTAEDAEAVAALLTAAEAVDDTGEHFVPADLVEWWVNDLVDLSREGLAVVGPDGQVVGYATVLAPPTFRGAFGVHLEGRVHPDVRGRGVGRALLAWQLDRGTRLHAERHPEVPARLTVSVPTTMPALERLAGRAGLTAVRWYREMERPLTDPPSLRTVPGVELVPFSWDRDDEVRRAHNAAFVEHHGSSERDVPSWQVMFTGQRAFRPDLSVLAIEDGAVVGYVLAYVFEADTLATGAQQAALGQIGVLPQARGRGVATAVITAALAAAADAGCRSAALQVDTENVTGALRLYESLGFTARRTQVSWSRDVPPIAQGQDASPARGGRAQHPVSCR
jgi:mycothiol synthase